jgi:hypothetical protein
MRERELQESLGTVADGDDRVPRERGRHDGNDKVREIGATAGVSQRTIREWCERQLLTDQGLRGQVLREPGASRGLRSVVADSTVYC